MSNFQKSCVELFEKKDLSGALIIRFGENKSLQTAEDLFVKGLKTGLKEFHVVEATEEIKKLYAQFENVIKLVYHNSYDEAYDTVFPNDEKWIQKSTMVETLESYLNKEKRFNNALTQLVEILRKNEVSSDIQKSLNVLAWDLVDTSIDFRKGFVFSISLNPEIINLREEIESVDTAFDDILEVDWNQL
jgi:hypothetical protein